MRLFLFMKAVKVSQSHGETIIGIFREWESVKILVPG